MTIPNYDQEIEKMYHPENFKPDTIYPEEQEVSEKMGGYSLSDDFFSLAPRYRTKKMLKRLSKKVK